MNCHREQSGCFMVNIRESSLRVLFTKQSRKYAWIATPYKKHKARNDGAEEFIKRFTL